MNHNIHNTKRIYKTQLTTALIIQSLLWLTILVGLESIYLFGSNSFLKSDLSYFGIISTLLLILFIKSIDKDFLYRKLRPKLSLLFFQNISNVIVSIFISIVAFSIYTNIDTDNFSNSIGLFESITLMLSLPFSFFIWLSFQRISKASVINLIESKSLPSYHSMEPYLFMLVFALYGIFYDFIPQNFDYLILAPSIAIISCILIGVIINSYILKKFFLYSTLQEDEEILDQKKELGFEF
ncbi:MAG: hypothetical protein R3321_08925, partial [Nitrososphaeraceae archaeon]|nr:hypothetical protein [Nitrososphaeraceae archaeon]